MGGGALPGVSRTAVWVAGLRATEHGRDDRLFDDPFAAAFVAAAGGVPEAAGVPPGASEFLAIRTRFYDDQARAASLSGARQVVLLAAGLDCRAFRLSDPLEYSRHWGGDFSIHLVGDHLDDRLVSLDGVTLVFEPLPDDPLCHGFAELGHHDGRRHDVFSSDPVSTPLIVAQQRRFCPHWARMPLPAEG